MKDTPVGTGVAFCVECGYEATQAEVDAGIQACPGCGSGGLPAWRKADVTIKINWHELRCLVIWAERWADQADREAKADPQGARMACLRAVYGIADRIHLQHLDKPALTFAGEVAELKAHFGERNVEVRGFPDNAGSGEPSGG